MLMYRRQCEQGFGLSDGWWRAVNGWVEMTEQSVLQNGGLLILSNQVAKEPGNQCVNCWKRWFHRIPISIHKPLHSFFEETVSTNAPVWFAPTWKPDLILDRTCSLSQAYRTSMSMTFPKAKQTICEQQISEVICCLVSFRTYEGIDPNIAACLRIEGEGFPRAHNPALRSKLVIIVFPSMHFDHESLQLRGLLPSWFNGIIGWPVFSKRGHRLC